MGITLAEFLAPFRLVGVRSEAKTQSAIEAPGQGRKPLNRN
jgi:hypothetical protein